jgi:hypothetical protein
LALLGQEENRVCVVRLETMVKMARTGVMVVPEPREALELPVRLGLQAQQVCKGHKAYLVSMEQMVKMVQ